MPEALHKRKSIEKMLQINHHKWYVEIPQRKYYNHLPDKQSKIKQIHPPNLATNYETHVSERGNLGEPIKHI